jgi:hypothetical protein
MIDDRATRYAAHGDITTEERTDRKSDTTLQTPSTAGHSCTML